MNITFFMATGILGAALVNLLDWLLLKNGRLLYFPSAGWVRFAMIGVLVGTGICAVLLLAGIISAPAFFGLIFLQAFTHEGYSIWCRHRANVLHESPRA